MTNAQQNIEAKTPEQLIAENGHLIEIALIFCRQMLAPGEELTADVAKKGFLMAIDHSRALAEEFLENRTPKAKAMREYITRGVWEAARK